MEINLLPKKQIKENKVFYLNKKIYSLSIFLIVFNILSIAFFIYHNYNLKKDLKNSRDRLEELKDNPINREINFINKEIAENNGLLEKLNLKIIKKENELPWKKIFAELSLHFDAGLKINELETDPNHTNKILISGKAINREKLLELEKKLNNSQLIKQVDFPIDNLVANQDIDFTLELTIDNEN